MKPLRRACETTFCLCVLCWFWGMSCAGLAASAEPALESPSAADLRFHRVFVPADRPDEWPTDGKRYLPIDRAEFTRLLSDAAVRMETAPGVLAAQVAHTSHTARVVEQEYLFGRAVLEIRHHSSQPVLLPLEPWSAAISNARWVASAADDDDAKAGAPALLGNSGQGQLALLVNRSGRLVIDWTLRGYRNLSGTTVFALSLPQSADSEFVLETLAGLIPEVDRAVVEPINQATTAARWQIKTGGREIGPIRLTTKETQRQQRELTLFRQADNYRVSSQGIDLATTLEVDVHGNPLSSIQLELDPALQLVGAELDGVQLSWTVSTDLQTNQTSVRVSLPSSVTGTGKKVALRGIAAVKIGEPLTLPRLRAVGMSWQEGTAAVHVLPPLVVNRVRTTGAREVSNPQLAAGNELVPVQVQYFSHDGTVEVVVDPVAEQLSLNAAQRLEFVAGEVVSSFVADLRVLRGEFGALTFNVEPDWQVDAVETDNPAMLTEWDVEGTDPQRRLTIRLAKPLAAKTPLRLKVLGRRTMPLGDPLPLTALRMLSTGRHRSVRETMWLLEPESLDVQLRGDERIERIDTTALPVTDPLYVDPAPRGTAFVLDQEALSVEVSVSPRKPRFAADIRCTVEVREGRISESCSILCQPSGAIMERLLVHVSQDSKPDNWQWTGDASLGPIAVRKLSPDEQLAATIGSTGQTWEVSWRAPQREAFTITCAQNYSFRKITPVTLISTPEAADQAGKIFVRAIEDAPVRIVNRGVVAVPTSGAGFPALRGEFRFDPRRNGLDGKPLLLIAPETAELRSTGAWAWSCQLESRISAGASASHLAVFRLQSAGRSRVTVNLPTGASLRAVWVNETALPIAQFDASHGVIPIALPSGEEFSTVSIDYVTTQSLPQFVAGCEAPFPSLDAPVLTRKWRLWVPRDYAVPTDSVNAHRYSRHSSGVLWRLFGVLANEENSESRNPLNRKFWSFSSGSTPALDGARENLVAFLESLGNQALAANSAPSRASWGSAVTIAAKRANIDLWIARGMLEEMGVEATQPLPPSPSTTPLEQGANLLRQANLLVAVCDDRYVLVSQRALALNQNRYVEIENLPAVYVSHGTWAEDLFQAGKLATPLELVTTENWLQTRQFGSNPWIVPTGVVRSLADSRGWKLYEFELADGQTINPLIANTPTIRALALALAMVVFAIGLCLGQRAFRWWTAVCAIAFAAALLLPLPWVPVASAVLLGALASWLLRACHANRRQRRHSLPGAVSSVGRGLQATASLLLMTACIAGTVNRTSADEPADALIPRVLFPINQVRLPVGDKVYVPDNFYRALLETAAKARGVPSGWIITQTRYRTALTRESLQPEGAALAMRASFEIYSFQRDLRVRLPFSGEGLRLAVGSVRIDGQPTVDAQATDAEVFVRIGEAGAHRIEMTLLPMMQVLGISNGFEFDVPPVAASLLELTGPDAARVDVPDAQAPVEMEQERGRVVATVGSNRRLSLRWPAGSGVTGQAPAFELDELQWARVQPGGLLVDTRLNIRVTTGRVKQLSLIADARLRLITPTGPGLPIASVRTTPGDPQLVSIDLAEPIQDRGTVELRFVVADVSGIGNLRMPRLEVSDVKPTRRWCAVSVDSSLDFAEQKAEELQAIAIPEFLAAWGTTGGVPHSAFKLPRGESLWSLASRTKNVSGTANESLSLLVEPMQTRLTWEAKLEIRTGSAVQWRVQVPPELVVTEVAVTRAENADNLERWSRDPADNSISIRLLEADSGPQQITIEGVLPRAAKTSVRAPRLSLLEAMRGSYSLAVYRSDKVLAEVQATGNWEPLDSAPQRFQPAVASGLVWAKVTDDPAADATIDVRPNVVRAKVDLATILNYDGDKWTADVDLRIQAQSGAVDSIVLFAPREWQGPAVVDSSPLGNATLSIEEVPGGKSRRILVRPTSPIRDSVRLKLRGEIGATEGGRLSVPDVRPLGLELGARHVVLPTQMELQSIRWDTSGLTEVELGAALALGAEVHDTHLAFAVSGEQFQATLRLTEAEPVSALVELGENFVVWQSDGRYFGLAKFSIAPAGLTHCTLEMPAGLRPIHCRLGGVPTALMPIDGERFQVAVAVQRVPQTLEILFRSELPSPSGEVRLVAPGLSGLDCRRTLWVVSGPANRPAAMTLNDASTIAEADYDVARHAAAERLRKIGEELALDLSEGDSRAWLAPNQLDGPISPRGEAVSAEKPAESASVRFAAPTHPGMEQVIARVLPTTPPLKASIQGKATILRLRSEFTPGPTLVTRSLLAFAAVAVGMLCVVRWPSETTDPIAAHWLYAAVGVIWWMWLSPGFVALFFFAAAIFCATRARRAHFGLSG